MISNGGVFRRLGVAAHRRFEFKLTDDIRPEGLGTGALFGYGFYPVAEHGAGVGGDAAFEDAFVVVDEEARGDEDLREALFHLVELDGAADGVSGATAELALVVNGRAFAAEIDARRKGAEEGGRRGVEEIALVGAIGDPAETALLGNADGGMRSADWFSGGAFPRGHEGK